MAHSSLTVPSLRLHKPSGRAVVTLGAKDHYLGAFGSEEAKAAYERLIGEWLARGRIAQSATAAEGPSVNELMLHFLRFADTHYCDGEGKPTREVVNITTALRPLKKLYGQTPARTFGPLAFKSIRKAMIDAGLSRRVINQRMGIIRRVFKWAASEELVPADTYHGLLSVDGLRYGRSGAREADKVTPVPDAHVDVILPFLPPTVRAMVEIQRFTGMRSGELCRMSAAEIDMSGPVWLYRPSKHKSAHHGRSRMVALGSQCQRLIMPLLTPNPQALLFTPKAAKAERNAIARAKRKTRVQPTQMSRAKPNPKRAPGERYTTNTYYGAVRYAMEAAMKAGQLAKEEFWHPHRLRHSAAQNIQRNVSLEAARAYLGHAKADMTAIYAGIDKALAIGVAEKYG